LLSNGSGLIVSDPLVRSALEPCEIAHTERLQSMCIERHFAKKSQALITFLFWRALGIPIAYSMAIRELFSERTKQQWTTRKKCVAN